MSKYLITLEVESERSLNDVTRPMWGAFMISANEWKVIHTEEIESEGK